MRNDLRLFRIPMLAHFCADSPETGVGGFILPNDHVHVILSRRDKEAEKAAGVEVHTSEESLLGSKFRRSVSLPSPDRIDTAFIDRLLSKCTDHLSLLAAPATLDRVYDFGDEAFDSIVDSLRATVPCIVLDIPHQWTGWTKRTLIAADDILVVAGPDLANLRNAKNMLDLLRAARPNDRRPSYCLNLVGVPKRPEIKPADFAKALDDQPVAVIPFEPQMFGTAANNGQMIAELSSSHRTAETFRQLAHLLTGRGETKKSRSGLFAPIIEMLKRSA